MQEQIDLFHEDALHALPPILGAVPEPQQVPCLDDYDRFVVFFSGGKDSVACVLHLLESGVSNDLIELHHHCVDGREGSDLMDWPVTDAYCRAFAEAFNLRIFFSWKVGGIEREMLRDNALTAPIAWESETGEVVRMGGDAGKPGTRKRFPQVTADLRVRWCSAYVKIDVGSRLLTNEPRFRIGKTLVLTGERAEESSARANYAEFEPDRSDNRNGQRVKRWIDHWRPIHKWKEGEVWNILRRHRVNPHPAYWVGLGRTSCMTCIFGGPDQWATIRSLSPERFERISRYEEEFGCTIHRNQTVRQQADRGTPLPATESIRLLAMGHQYPADMIIVKGDWAYPPGAFGDSCGPT